jgi:hypothetical protein
MSLAQPDVRGEVPAIERDMAASMHHTLAFGSFVVLPMYWAFAALGLLPDAPKRPFLRHHLHQASLLHLMYLGVSLVTCGLGFVLLALPVYLTSMRAHDAARRGEWYRLRFGWRRAARD